MYWLEQAEADVPAENDWLSASEAARLNAMRFAKRRADWRLGRWTAKRAVAAYLDVPGHSQALANIEIRPAASGAPEVFVLKTAAPATISLSHRDGTALCAVAPSGTALGCDLELIETRSDGFVADYFTAEEQALVARVSSEDRPRLLALLWSAKESALKALHEGLRLDTRSLTVSPIEALRSQNQNKDESLDDPALSFPQDRDNVWHPLQVCCTDGQVFHGWWQQTGPLLRTLVAAPPPFPPIPLIIKSANQTLT
ncbi:MAG TPA: 4'-phosphopantetheinyl transferase superfamily protein [Terriglobales bacterium]|nr:4'-phosphopantetheinyl transferase superfamily protein [Terriglobales bacterium]